MQIFMKIENTWWPHKIFWCNNNWWIIVSWCVKFVWRHAINTCY